MNMSLRLRHAIERGFTLLTERSIGVYLKMSLAVFLTNSCATIEQQCERDSHLYESFYQCVTAKREMQEHYNRSNQALIDLGNSQGGLSHSDTQSPDSRRYCTPNALAPMARIGCRFVCIDSRWAEICN